MPSVVSSYSGSQTATLDTEHVLGTSALTVAGTYQLVVDTANMVNGDVLILRIYGKARSSDTERLLYQSSFAHAQTENLKASIAVVSPHHMKVTLEQTDGVGRAFPWAVYEL